jgi:plastocyanin domain-containing protein
MIRALALALLVVGSFACKKTDKPAPKVERTAPVTAGTVADGVRKIPVEASKEGYAPDRIAGKPGEKIVLVFKRTIEGDCLATVQIADAKPVDLPMNTPVEVPVTVPESGELTFVCAMGMFKGTIVADAKGNAG